MIGQVKAGDASIFFYGIFSEKQRSDTFDPITMRSYYLEARVKDYIISILLQ